MSLLKFWGVQGSCPGNIFKDHLGDNTSCISIEDNKRLFIFDAGSGIRYLSQQLNPADYEEIYLLITHSHWDHIQGFPFFGFLHSNSKITIYSHNQQHIDAMIEQINGVNFPLHYKDLAANIVTTTNITDINTAANVSITTVATNHHGDCIGYRFKNDKADVCYIPDNQLHNTTVTNFDEFCKFVKGTQYLIHDSQYTENDMPHKENWGHSTVKDTCRLATESHSNHLILFHHDPDRSKSSILAIEKTCNERHSFPVTAAYEGLKLNLLGN